MFYIYICYEQFMYVSNIAVSGYGTTGSTRSSALSASTIVFMGYPLFLTISSVKPFSLISSIVVLCMSSWQLHQILDETDCISHCTNTLGKGMNPVILPPAMGK